MTCFHVFLFVVSFLLGGVIGHFIALYALQRRL